MFKGKKYGSSANQTILSINSNFEEICKDKVSFTKEQYQQLLSLLQHKDFSTACPSVNHAQVIHQPVPNEPKASKMSGIPRCFSSCNNKFASFTDIPWISDSGATDQMICSTSYFSSIILKVSYSVKLSNSASILVTHLGNVQVTKNILLTNV